MSFHIFVEPFTWILLCHYRGSLHSLRGVFLAFHGPCRNLPEGRRSYFPYILLNEIQTMLSQVVKLSSKVLIADLCTDHAHCVKYQRSTVLHSEGTKSSRWKAGLFLPILFWKFANLLILCRFSDILCGFLFLLNNFFLQNLKYATYSNSAYSW